MSNLCYIMVRISDLVAPLVLFYVYKYEKRKFVRLHLYINLACLFVCLFVSNKRQNG